MKLYTAVNLVAELTEAVQMNRLSRLEKSLNKIDMLVIDELSYLTFNRCHSEMLFQIINERSNRYSLLKAMYLTTREIAKKWITPLSKRGKSRAPSEIMSPGRLG